MDNVSVWKRFEVVIEIASMMYVVISAHHSGCICRSAQRRLVRVGGSGLFFELHSGAILFYAWHTRFICLAHPTDFLCFFSNQFPPIQCPSDSSKSTESLVSRLPELVAIVEWRAAFGLCCAGLLKNTKTCWFQLKGVKWKWIDWDLTPETNHRLDIFSLTIDVELERYKWNKHPDCRVYFSACDNRVMRAIGVAKLSTNNCCIMYIVRFLPSEQCCSCKLFESCL